jgi:hypothetical protein
VRKTEERKLLGISRLRWENNIKMDFREVGWEHGLDQSCSRFEHVAGSFECGNEPSKYIKCGEFPD